MLALYTIISVYTILNLFYYVLAFIKRTIYSVYATHESTISIQQIGVSPNCTA